MAATLADTDPFDVRRAREAPGLLRAFNDAGILTAADVQVARRLAELVGETGGEVVLAAALAVRAPRLGHVHVDLATVRETAAVDADDPVDLATLPWPDAGPWLAAVRAGPLVAHEPSPLHLEGTQLYLDRYWREEGQVADDLRALAADEPPGIDDERLRAGLRRLFGRAEPGDRQRLAAAAAVLRRFAVVAGGPGTGKTTTVARIVALLAEQAAGDRPPLVALAAPTGKAAARLEEAVHGEARALDVDHGVRENLLALEAMTLHRLLGRRPDSDSRFRHHRGNRLPHDVVIVDETSMVGLSMMARLVESIRPDARLVLVGDPGQLTSIEAGAVLGDVVGDAVDGLRLRPATRARLEAVLDEPVTAAPSGSPVADGIVVLEHVHRYGGGIAELAAAMRRGDADEAMRVLHAGHEDVLWLPADPAETPDAELDPVRREVVASARALRDAARAGDARAALDALGRFRLLCAHRHGPSGVTGWTTRIEAWLTAAIPGFTPTDRWYPGRPLLITENDYALRLYNGDTGVVVDTSDGRPTAAFDRRGEVAYFPPTRLDRVETVHAMTIHKAQGSQFAAVAVLLPTDSRLLTRELLYTAVTRAQDRLVLAATEDTVREAVRRRAERGSGLRRRLAGDDTGDGAAP